jgi:sugar phosphate isomerase/epimerase
MKKVSRRDFMNKTAMGLGSAFIFSRLSGFGGNGMSKTHPIGFQTYPLRESIGKDFKGTLKMMSDLGYHTLEMCSPAGYMDSGFGLLAGMKGSELKKIIDDLGMNCPSCHFTFGELKDKSDESIAWAKDLGLSHMVCSSFWLPKTATMKDYEDASAALNKAAEKIDKAGMQTGYHNHEMEFETRDGLVIYDRMMEVLDPKLVKMQFQTEVINIGFKGSTYFKKYPGRFISTHMSDWTKDKKAVPIGKGIIDWPEFLEAAKIGGVQHFLVEMDQDTFKESAIYLNGLLEKA